MGKLFDISSASKNNINAANYIEPTFSNLADINSAKDGSRGSQRQGGDDQHQALVAVKRLEKTFSHALDTDPTKTSLDQDCGWWLIRTASMWRRGTTTPCTTSTKSRRTRPRLISQK